MNNLNKTEENMEDEEYSLELDDVESLTIED